jgi:hypothetical protein
LLAKASYVVPIQQPEAVEAVVEAEVQDQKNGARYFELAVQVHQATAITAPFAGTVSFDVNPGPNDPPTLSAQPAMKIHLTAGELKDAAGHALYVEIDVPLTSTIALAVSTALFPAFQEVAPGETLCRVSGDTITLRPVASFPWPAGAPTAYNAVMTVGPEARTPIVEDALHPAPPFGSIATEGDHLLFLPAQ